MVKDNLRNIRRRIDLRKSLQDLRQEIKNHDAKYAMLYELNNDYSMFVALLRDMDPKVRKNAALIIGEIGSKELLRPLYDAYEREATLFVKSSYLRAMENFDYREYLPLLKRRMKDLQEMDMTTAQSKHYVEEMHAISELILLMEGMKMHKFCGYDNTYNVILLTNRNHIGVTMQQLDEPTAKAFNAGIIMKTDRIGEIMKIRTYEELLFQIDDMRLCNMDAFDVAAAIRESGLMKLLDISHEEGAPYYFRIEIRSHLSLDKRSTLAKKIASVIERDMHGQLVNSTSNYEIELRLIENKQGKFQVLLKLYTWKDGRFDYRRQYIASSIRPVNAALTVALAKEFMKEDAQVLDPFCGVGTMLIERHKQVRAKTSYGIDIYPTAIEKARINTEIAGQTIHYINKDFADFTHDYLFDEVITNMPMVLGKKTEQEVYAIYKMFFQKIRTHLKEDAVLILYVRNWEFVKELAPRSGFEIVRAYAISEKDNCYLMILK